MSILFRNLTQSLFILLLVGLCFSLPFLSNIQMTSFLNDKMINVFVLWISILLEAMPFLLIGTLISSGIQTWVKDHTLQKIFRHSHPLWMLPISLIGLILPLCECTIIPVIRRLIQKGMPVYLGITALLAIPIVNPFVIFSTLYAFPGNHLFLLQRLGYGIGIALFVSLIFYLFFTRKEADFLKKGPHTHHSSTFRSFVTHGVDEWIETMLFLAIGAFLASLIQVFIPRESLLSVGGNPFLANGLAMSMAYLFSLCSQADAFLASSFTSTFTPSALLAFLVFGPMLDLKNTFMLLRYFKWKFVLLLTVIITLICYIVLTLFPLIGG